MRNRRFETLKFMGRRLLQIPSIYRLSSKPHVLLFSVRRSGSTLLRDMIYSQPGFNYMDQPLDVGHFCPYKRFLPDVEFGQYICLGEAAKIELKACIDKLLARRYIGRSQWQVWDRNYHWVWERYVLKILNASAMIEWFQAVYQDSVEIIFLARHPIPHALSIMARNWGLTAEAYLNNDDFRTRYLSSELEGFGRKVLRQGSPLEKHVLEWCLHNLVPLRLWKERSWITVSYESIVSNPPQAVARLCSRLNLPCSDRMIDVIHKPTRTATSSSRKLISSRGPQTRLTHWLNQVDKSTLAKIALILDYFQTDLYSVDDPFPDAGFDA